MNRPMANCVVDTDPLLSYFGITAPVAVTVGYLFAYLAIIHMLTYLALRWAVGSPSASPSGGGGCGGWVGRFRRAVCQLSVRMGKTSKTNSENAQNGGLQAAVEV